MRRILTFLSLWCSLLFLDRRCHAQTTRPVLPQFGVNISTLNGAPENLPGHLNGEVFPTPEEHLRYYASKGLTHVRYQGTWERLQPRVNGALGEQPLDHYDDPNNPLRDPVKLVRRDLDLAQKYHLKVYLDLAHNYGSRYVGYDGTWKSKSQAQLGSERVPIDALADYNVKLVKEFGKHPAVIGIELMNEPHDLKIGADGWMDACQRCIDAIRAVDPNILIFIDGYGWSSAEFWEKNNPNLHKLHDPSDRLIFTAHQYFDDSSQGVYKGAEATKPTNNRGDIGARRIEPFIGWVEKHDLQGHAALGEFGAPDTAPWAEVVRVMLTRATGAGLMLTAHQDVPYANDPYVMNLYPGKNGADRRAIVLMRGFMGKSATTRPTD